MTRPSTPMPMPMPMPTPSPTLIPIPEAWPRPGERCFRSPYMEWVKSQPPVEYPLVTSGLLFCPLDFLDMDRAKIEVNGVSFYGHPPLLSVVARHSGVDPECVVLTEGTSMANHLAMASLVRPGDEVLIECPTYELLPSLASYLGAQLRVLPRRAEDGFRVRPEEVRRRVNSRTRLIVLSNIHNPTGALIDEAMLREVGEIALSVGAHVLVDEVYLESTRPSIPRPRSAFHLGPQFITTNSLTKCYGLNGLRCGWALATPELAKRMWRLNDLFGVIPSHPSEQISIAAFAAMAKLRLRSVTHLEVNRTAFREILGSHPALEMFESAGGTMEFPRLRREKGDVFAKRLLQEHSTSVVPGCFFGSPEHIRIGLGGDPEKVRKGLLRVAQCLSESTTRS